MELDIKFLLKLSYDTGKCCVWNGSASVAKLHLGEVYEPCGSLLSIYDVKDVPAPMPLKIITIQLQSVQKDILHMIKTAKFIPEYVELTILAKNISPFLPEEQFQILKKYVGSWQLVPCDSNDKIFVKLAFNGDSNRGGSNE